MNAEQDKLLGQLQRNIEQGEQYQQQYASNIHKFKLSLQNIRNEDAFRRLSIKLPELDLKNPDKTQEELQRTQTQIYEKMSEQKRQITSINEQLLNQKSLLDQLRSDNATVKDLQGQRAELDRKREFLVNSMRSITQGRVELKNFKMDNFEEVMKLGDLIGTVRQEQIHN